MDTLKLGSRGSQLALYQANAARALLESHAGVACDVVVIKTSGDRLAEASLADIGGKRLFVKEIEDALLAGTIDLAVHSSKDMPVLLPDGLDIAAALPRDDPRDALVLPGPLAGACATIEEAAARLGRAPRIGTSSVRRIAQLGRLFPGARFLPIRGNLDTRLRKLDAGEFDAIVLAAAGLRRLRQEGRISIALPVAACVPAPGQGIIALEIRSDDVRVRALAHRINDGDAAAALAGERAVVKRLGGGCQMPIGAHAAIADGRVEMTAVVVSLDGARAVRAEAAGTPGAAAEIGASVAERLLAEGAADILADIQRTQATVGGLQP